MNLYTKQIDPQAQKTNFQIPKRKGEKSLSVIMLTYSVYMLITYGINIYTLVFIKQITNKDLLYSRGSSTKYFEMTYKGK